MTDDLACFDRLAARVYTDRRMTPAVRDFVLAFGWALYRDPTRHSTRAIPWNRAKAALGYTAAQMWQVVADDAPRHDPQRPGTPPVPNRGGLLPAYIGIDWTRRYQLADPHWTPPPYSLNADDWPAAADLAVCLAILAVCLAILAATA